MSPMPSTRAINFAVFLALAGGCAPTQPGETVMNKPISPAFDARAEVQPVTELLRSYEAALNAANVEAIMGLYAEDGVFMAQHRYPAIGREQVQTAYREILGMIRLDVGFTIDEVVVVSPTVAWARTRSAGTTTIVANGAQVSEGNQELFVLLRADASADWRIGRYIFATTQPRD
jgi:uncharacterized protein (TIGR02246 family)